MEIIAFGDIELMDGFALLGIKTYAGQTVDAVNTRLKELESSQQTALVFIQQDLWDMHIPMLHKLRNQGGRILICEIPQLQASDTYRPEVESLIVRVLGESVLEVARDQ